MKKFIAVMVVLMGLMTACDMEYGTAEEIEIGNVYDYDFEGSEEIPEFKTINDVRIYLFYFNRKPDSEIWGTEDYWQTPKETYLLKTGDCEDFCLLFSYIIKKQFNYNPELILVSNNNIFHVIVFIPETQQYIDVILKYILDTTPKIIKKIPYEKALWMTINYHELVGKYRL
jgi:hypothetical protein